MKKINLEKEFRARLEKDCKYTYDLLTLIIDSTILEKTKEDFTALLIARNTIFELMGQFSKKR